jgi:hypothetical protein
MTTSPTTSTTTAAARRSTATPTSRRDGGGRRRRASSATLLGAALLLAAPVLAACSTAGDGPTAGASSGATGSTSSASAQLGSCLRDAGFDVDDPDLSRGVVVAPPRGVDVDEYVAAFDACRAELPADQGGGPGPSEEDLAALQEANLEVARCVREKGFTDFADPVDGVFPSGASVSTDTTALGAQDEAFLACDAEHGPNSAGADQ